MWNSLSQPWRVSFEQGWIVYCSGSFPVGLAESLRTSSLRRDERANYYISFLRITNTNSYLYLSADLMPDSGLLR